MSTSNKPVFAHHRLEVYHLALRMAALAKDLADKIPRGHPTASWRCSGDTAQRVWYGSSIELLRARPRPPGVSSQV